MSEREGRQPGFFTFGKNKEIQDDLAGEIHIIQSKYPVNPTPHMVKSPFS
jgi:hypothetical protein